MVSDIVGSTVRWVADELAMRGDLEAHDEVVTRVVTRCGGRVFKHTGDGAMATFADPVAAVEAAIGLQAELAAVRWRAAEPLQVRVGVHTGGVHERGGDLFGSAVNRAARLVGVCPAGAVVVSGATAELLVDRVGPAVVPVGEVVLRGFEGAERVFAVVDDRVTRVDRLDGDLIGPAAMGNLPHVDGELFGRADELGHIWEVLTKHRLVTLVGVGGMGKTRLALEVAAGLEDRHPDGVWWCDLSAVTTGDAVAPVVLDALCGRRSEGRTVVESIIDRLHSVSALVVFDNCEHVLAAAGQVIGAVRSSCPAASILTTSREALGLPGEYSVPVGSLDRDAAVALFAERARAVRPDLDLGTDEVDGANAAVVSICERLDGIPLAIELAAARCRSMSPPEIADRLADRFRLLRGGRTSGERHRTLQAAVDWSYSLLDDDERELFDTMAVFAGGTLLDGIVAVTGLDEYDAVDLVDRLVARSLVVPSTTRLGTRYQQLETLRQYGEDRLVERGRIDEVRDRHLDWVCELSIAFAMSLGTPSAASAFQRYAAEIDNQRVAVAHAVATGRSEVAYQIVSYTSAGAICRPSFEILDWIDPIGHTGPWTETRSETAAVFGLLGALVGHTDAMPRAVAAITPDHRRRWLVVRFQITERATAGDATSIEKLLDTAGPVGSDFERLSRDMVSLYLANIRAFEENLAERQAIEARAVANAVIDRIRATGDPLMLAEALFAQGLLLYNLGAPEDALAVAIEAEAIAREHDLGMLSDMASYALSLALGQLTLPAGEVDPAAAQLHRRLTEVRQGRSRMVQLEMLGAIGRFLVPHDPVTAHTLELVRSRLRPGYEGLLPDPATVLDAGTIGRIRAGADRLDLADATDLALSALEQLIAGAPAPGAQ